MMDVRSKGLEEFSDTHTCSLQDPILLLSLEISLLFHVHMKKIFFSLMRTFKFYSISKFNDIIECYQLFQPFKMELTFGNSQNSNWMKKAGNERR